MRLRPWPRTGGGLRATVGLAREPRWLQQVHGIDVADLDALPEGSVPQADAAVTTRLDTACAVLTADCLPVLLAAADGSAVAAAHAGWRGLAAGVLDTTVAALRARMADDSAVVAWLGPAISVRHFEVRDDVRAAFLAADPRNDTAFNARPRRTLACDLPQLARLRPHGARRHRGRRQRDLHVCRRKRFFSHRRDVQHRGLAGTGRIASLIWRQS